MEHTALKLFDFIVKNEDGDIVRFNCSEFGPSPYNFFVSFIWGFSSKFRTVGRFASNDSFSLKDPDRIVLSFFVCYTNKYASMF